MLVCGQSGSGKSTIVTGLFERITDLKYQVCLVDPEGDYENLPGVRTFGDQSQAPSIKQLKEGLEDPESQVVVNMVGVSAGDRPSCFASLIADIQEIRIRTGRPHWLMVDEAHHVLPSAWAPSSPELTGHLSNLVLITVHPGHVSPVALDKITTVTATAGNMRNVSWRQSVAFISAVRMPSKICARRIFTSSCNWRKESMRTPGFSTYFAVITPLGSGSQ